MNKHIDSEYIVSYLLELSKCPKGSNISFGEQYIKAGGQELKDKFWNKKSSSRLCFDLFRDIADLESVEEFQFEKRLPGLKSGGSGPYIDVYIETVSEIIFIESKYSESSSYRYYTDKKGNGEYYLSEGYWKLGEYGKKRMNIEERYYCYGFAKKFVEFIRNIYKIIETKADNPQEWFDIKQETCHLLGILFFLHENLRKQKKKISFYNVYWEFNEDKSLIADKFVKKAKELVKNLLPGVKFSYEAFPIHDLLTGKKTIVEGYTFRDIENRIEPFKKLAESKTRKEMKNV